MVTGFQLHWKHAGLQTVQRESNTSSTASCQDMCPKKPRCLQHFITCSAEQFNGSDCSSQEYWEIADANTYTRREICSPGTLGLVNIGLVAQDKNCFQAGVNWDKNTVSSEANSDLAQLDVADAFGTNLGMFNNTYRVYAVRFSVRRRCNIRLEMTYKK